MPIQKSARTQVFDEDSVASAAMEGSESILELVRESDRLELGQRPVQNVLLTTKRITTGGVSGVVLAQARYLLEAGFDVTIAVRSLNNPGGALPKGAKLVQMEPDELPSQLREWASICRNHEIDVVIDHQILYSRDWPAFALMALALGVPTIGWIHNFAARPLYDLTRLTSFLTEHLPVLAQVVTLSPLDAVYWKMRGVPKVAYLPNPASPMILDSMKATITKQPPTGRPVELIWWGRLDEHTKQVHQLLAVATELRRLDLHFKLRIIGPAWRGFTPEKLRMQVRKRGLYEHIEVVGPLHGPKLLEAVDAADLFVSTSIIEGYPLTLLEAQSRGLPIVMYEMPWLLPVQGNEGMVSVPQSDPAALAREIVDISQDPERFARLSQATQEAARRMAAVDFTQLYKNLFEGRLPDEYSPVPDLDRAKEMIDLLIFFLERHAVIQSPQRSETHQQSRPGGMPQRPFLRRAASGLVRHARPYGHLVMSVTPGLRPTVKRVYYALMRRL